MSINLNQHKPLESISSRVLKARTYGSILTAASLGLLLCLSSCGSTQEGSNSSDSSAVANQKAFWKDGVIKQEFLYDTASFPSCHSATIAETPAGLVAAFFGGTKERNPDVEIYLCRLVDGKWTAPVSVANGIQNDTLRYPTWNPVLYQVPGGELQLYYKVGPKPSEWKGWKIVSKDNGLTWSQPEAMPEGFLGPIKNQPVLLPDGKTLLSPSSTEDHGWHVHIEKSTDFGKTWSMVGKIDNGKFQGAIQPTILVHPGGKLQILCRSKDRAILQSWSEDNGETWTPLSRTNLPNNNSGIDAVTLQDGSFALVYNHVLPPEGKYKGARTPLNLAISKDGVNWSAAAILEDSPISQYSYPYIIATSDGKLHAIYTWRREKIAHAVIDPSALKPLPIKDSIWPAVPGYVAPVPES